jgi:tetratricopeptide (TPR) repeat protein
MNIMKVTPACSQVLYLVIAGFICAAAISCTSHSNVAPVNSTQSAAEYVAQADELYAQREDLVQLRQGISLLQQALIADPGDYAAAWRVAKFNYYLATHTDNSDERDKAFGDGIEGGKAAVRIEDGKPDGHFWLGANYGGSAQLSILAGLTAVSDIRKEMETVLRLDEGYQNGSAYMVLGLVYLRAPKLVGGDRQKAVAEMEKGLRFGKTNALLHLHLAEAYLKVERTADARQQLNAIISMTPDKDYLPEYKEAVAEAHKLLDKTG